MLFKTFTKCIQVTLNVIGLMVWWKMHYSTIYCTQLIEEQTTQWPKEKVKKDKQRFSKHAHKTKERVTRTTLRTRVLRRVNSSWSTSGIYLRLAKNVLMVFLILLSDILIYSGMYNHWFNGQTYVLRKVKQFLIH